MIYIIAIFSMFTFSLPVFAQDCMDDTGRDSIMNRNEAMVFNEVEVESETGDNMAEGSYGGNGGRGGAILNSGGDVDTSTTGNGGLGASSYIGGTVISGDATAELENKNGINTNLAESNRCACIEEDDDCACGSLFVRTSNRAMLVNEAEAEAETSENMAEGSYAGYGGDGGKIENNGGDVDDSITGAGADAGASDAGGLVQTGVSYSRANVVNVVNRNVTRSLR